MEDEPDEDDERNPAGDQLEGADGIDILAIVARLPAGVRSVMGRIFGFVTPASLFPVFHGR